MEEIIACIYEGTAEKVIIETLLNANKLIFNTEDLLNEELIKRIKPKQFQTKYLNQDYEKKIKIIRVIDKKSEGFKIAAPFEKQISEIVSIITRPEIEILVIIGMGEYDRYKRQSSRGHQKPSDYCTQVLNIKNVKTEKFVRQHFSNVEYLINCLNEYHSKIDLKPGEKDFITLLR
ncbi:hypothetical protein [Desemzia sp. FAM 24101]|uniref:hypothetical protein n=1 Tax=unclassified Desemzia TaxID=2685243 RepID=UPI00388B9AD3